MQSCVVQTLKQPIKKALAVVASQQAQTPGDLKQQEAAICHVSEGIRGHVIQTLGMRMVEESKCLSQ